VEVLALNEKRKIEPELDPDNPEARTRSDVAPKQKQESGAPARHISGLRPAMHLPATPSVPPAPLTPADLLEDGWDDEEEDEDEDSGPTLLDQEGSVPREVVAEARAISDPLGGEPEPETREVATRQIPTHEFEQDEAPTGELPTVQNPLPVLGRDEDEEDDADTEFNHDDFPTRQTPMGFEQALLAYPLPSDSDRGLHEMLPAPGEDSTPDLASSPSLPSLGPTVARPVAPLSPLAMRAISPLSPSIPSLIPPAPVSPMASSLAAPMPTSPDETAQMLLAPPHPRADEHPSSQGQLHSQPPPPAERSSVSQISQISHASYPSHASHVPQAQPTPRGLMYPTPTSISGAPLPPANTVRFAFLRNLSPNNDPPLSKLVVVAAISFFATLVLSAFVAWVIVLVRH
jgi:hypothetical protein